MNNYHENQEMVRLKIQPPPRELRHWEHRDYYENVLTYLIKIGVEFCIDESKLPDSLEHEIKVVKPKTEYQRELDKMTVNEQLQFLRYKAAKSLERREQNVNDCRIK